MNNPLHISRLGLALVVAGALLAGLGDGIREAAQTGEANWTFFLDVMGLLFALAGGVLEARSADLLFTFAPAETRRRALIRLIAGIAAMLVACVALGSVDEPFPRGLAGALLMAGIGFGSGGLFSLAWIYGGGYAANQIQDRADDDWR
jgi:drug/metabolite transporter (DMT)-like permease